MSGMLDNLMEVKALVDGERDNLLLAMAALASHGQISIIPRDERLTTKPVIVLPQRMYDRMLEIIPTEKEGQDDD